MSKEHENSVADSLLLGFLERYEEAKAKSTDGSFTKEADDRIREMFTRLLTEDVEIKTIQ